MSLRAFFVSLFFILPLYVSAHIAGTYDIHGFDPEAKQPYSGTLVIEHNGPTFTGHWRFEGSSEVDTGTGVRRGNCLSFVFKESNSDVCGTQLYKIEGPILTGPWVRFGADAKGVETAIKQGILEEHSSSH